MTRRNRSREGAGKSVQSWHKHELAYGAISGQLAKYRVKNKGRILLIDGNAGDGIGVDRPQLDLFDNNQSRTTPEMLMRLAEKLGNTDVLLCERDRGKRAELAKRFPAAKIIANHADAVNYIHQDHSFVVWVSDPCGPRDHGIVYMRTVARRVPSDFIVIFNEGFLDRIKPSTSPMLATCRERYLPMEEPQWWLDQLGRHHMTRTPIINASNHFKYRILVISNYLSDASKRKPFEVVR